MAYGTVYKLDSSGNFTTLYSFTGGSDGATPYAGVVVDAQGNLWGAASNGGAAAASGGYGTLFVISPGPVRSRADVWFVSSASIPEGGRPRKAMVCHTPA